MNGTDQKVTPISDEAVASAPMWLKVLVVVLGIAIVGMLALIFYRIMAGPGDEKTARQIAAPAIPASLPPIEARDFDVIAPDGASLVSVVPAGAEVFLHFRTSDGRDEVIILDRRTGNRSRLVISPPES